MRRPHRLLSLLAGLALIVPLPVALPTQAAAHPEPRAAKPAQRPFGADCRTRQVGSHVVAYCHNPYPETDRVALHIECERWWDIDTDSARVAAGPAMTVRLAGRCWKEVGSAWVSHRR